MSAQTDTISKLSYLLPTGTFLTFQVLAPLATNNGHCGLTEQILTAVTLAILVAGCIATSFTDSVTTSDGKVHTGFVTRSGILWVPGYDAANLPEDKQMFKLKKMDYLNAALSAIAFLTLTMFTAPVSTCFYPHLSETVLKTLPVLLATVLSWCCSFVTKVRHGYGNSGSSTVPAQVKVSSSNAASPDPIGTHDVATKDPVHDAV